jgi:hypothetical protein
VIQCTVFPALFLFYALACLLFKSEQDRFENPNRVLDELKQNFNTLDDRLAAIENRLVSPDMDHHLGMNLNQEIQSKPLDSQGLPSSLS